MVSAGRFASDEPALFQSTVDFVQLFCDVPDPVLAVTSKIESLDARIAWTLLGTDLFQDRSYGEIGRLLSALYERFPGDKLWTLPVPTGPEIEAVVESTFGSRNWSLFKNVAGIFWSVGLFVRRHPDLESWVRECFNTVQGDECMSVITLSNIRKTYPLGKQEVVAVKDASFSIEKGEFAAVSGPSGSGKSTILNMIGLIDIPSAGSININGIDVYKGVNLEDAQVQDGRWASDPKDKKKRRTSIPSKLDKRITGLRRSHIGFIFQTFNLIPVLNVYENVEFQLLLNSKGQDAKCPVDDFSKKQKEEWVNYLIERVGLSDWKTHKPSELSGGQRQRVAIARALVTKAPVILADEPTANLDSANSKQILSLMKQLNNDPELQTTFIFSTHDARIVKMCDHVVHLLDGNIINDEHKAGSDIYGEE